MKKNIIQITILTLVLLIGFSCKKILEQRPLTVIENDNVINSVKDLESVLNGAYDGLQSSNVLGGNMIFYSDLLADDADVRTIKLGAFGTNEIYNGNTSVQIGALRDMWRDCYSTINRANNIINIIDNGNKLSGAEYESKKNKIKAQAQFIRAVIHYELLRFWALPYDASKSGSNNQPGVVIRTKPTLSIDSLDSYKKQRASVEEVYNFVIEELKSADALFQQSGTITSIGYGSSMACKAMLARVFYFKGDNDNAINYAQQIVASNKYRLKKTDSLLVNYRNQGFPLPANCTENIFEIINTPIDNGNSLSSPYSRKLDYYFLIPLTQAQLLYNDSLDFRRKLFLNVSQNASQVLTGSAFPAKYDIPTIQANGSNVNYLRLPEMHLILAECYSIKGDDVNALLHYNKIRERGYKVYTPETSSSNLLEKIQYQRRIELNFEGDRYMFLRKNKLPLRLGNDYQKFLFKIPQEEIAGNADITQN